MGTLSGPRVVTICTGVTGHYSEDTDLDIIHQPYLDFPILFVLVCAHVHVYRQEWTSIYMCKLCQFREGFFKRQWPLLVWGMRASAGPQVWTSDQQLTFCGVSLSLCIGLNSHRTGVCAEVTLACGCL